jgi:prepilin-type N-terminal cleavage/methylation domain-containing protein
MKKGFTLVEIMIVVAIIGLLAAIAVPSFMRARTRSQQNACINNLRQIDGAKEEYAMEWGLTNLQKIADDSSAAFALLVGPEAYIKHFPLCPASTTDTANADQAGSDYEVNPIGSNVICNQDPGGDFAHILPGN